MSENDETEQMARWGIKPGYALPIETQEELDSLREDKKKLNEEISDLRSELSSVEDYACQEMLHKYGFPEHSLMAYQDQMIRDAIEHILIYDTLKGLGDK